MEQSQLTLDVRHSLLKTSVLLMVPPALPFKLVPRIQSELGVLKEQTDYVFLLYQLDRGLEP